MYVLCLLCYFFFFKEKTAYEMRISDWSSDVCSSDLLEVGDEVADVADRQWIDAREGLVEKHDRRVRRQRARDLCPPPFAARQRHRRRIAQPDRKSVV